jgi:hypothetical protein
MSRIIKTRDGRPFPFAVHDPDGHWFSFTLISHLTCACSRRGPLAAASPT